MRYISLLIMFSFGSLLAQDNKIIVKSQLSDALIYQQGAELKRTATVDLPKAEVELVFEHLDPSINSASIRFKAKADVTIIHQTAMVYTDTLEKKPLNHDEKAQKLRQAAISIEKDRLNKELQVYSKEESFINDNLKLGNVQEAVKLDDVIKASSFLRTRYLDIQNIKSVIEDKIRALDSEYYDIQNRMAQQTQIKTEQHIRYTVRLRSHSVQKAELSLQYYTAAAGWVPSYEARVLENQDSLQLIKYAKVFQQSRENWKNVSVSITNSNPSKDQSLPELNMELLSKKVRNSDFAAGINYGYNQAYAIAQWNPQIKQVSGIVRDENGEALPFVNIVLPECATGVTTDVNGGFTLAIPNNCRTIKFDYIGYSSLVFNISTNYMTVIMSGNHIELSEVVITKYSADKPSRSKSEDYKEETNYSPVVIQYTPTQVRFNPEGKYSISNTGEFYAVALEQTIMKAELIRECVPSMDPAVYLTARIPDWQQYNLMAGAMNIYQGDMYLGSSNLNPATASDTLSLSMGIDQDIQVKHKNTVYRNDKKALSSKIERERAFDIAIRNNKKSAVEIIIYDRVPVSYDEDIKIILSSIDGANHNKESGKLTWTLRLNSSEQKNIGFGYTIVHPADFDLNFQGDL